MGSDGLLSFISIRKLGSLKNSFATITSLSELFIRLEVLFCRYKRKVISITMAGAKTAEK